MRFATSTSTPAQIEPYLYSGWRVIDLDAIAEAERADDDPRSLIFGHDWAGFTLDALRERLASGLHATIELTEREE